MEGLLLPNPNFFWVHYWEEFFERIRAGDAERVRELVEQNPELTNTREEKAISALHLAAGHGEPEIVEFLLDRGADIECESTDTGSTPLKYAVFFANIEMVKLLLKKGARIDNPGGTKLTPLELALSATNDMFRSMGTPGTELDYARIANILRSKSMREPDS